MNIWEKIKLMWKGRSIAENLISIKSRWKDAGFWATLIGNVLALVGSLNGFVTPQTAIIVNAILGALYNYTRGLAKSQSDGVSPFKSSSEFIMGLVTMTNNALIDMQTGGVTTGVLAGTSVVLTHAIAAARDMANMRPSEAVKRAEGTDAEASAGGAAVKGK